MEAHGKLNSHHQGNTLEKDIKVWSKTFFCFFFNLHTHTHTLYVCAHVVKMIYKFQWNKTKICKKITNYFMIIKYIKNSNKF